MARKKTSKPKQEELIHIKLEYSEAKQAKKDILSIQMNVLKVVQIINQYRELRTKELENKKKIAAKLKYINTNIKNIKKILPINKIPKIFEKPTEEKETSEKKEKIQVIPKNTLESQLEEIQNKLKALQ